MNRVFLERSPTVKKCIGPEFSWNTNIWIWIKIEQKSPTIRLIFVTLSKGVMYVSLDGGGGGEACPSLADSAAVSLSQMAFLSMSVSIFSVGELFHYTSSLECTEGSKNIFSTWQRIIGISLRHTFYVFYENKTKTRLDAILKVFCNVLAKSVFKA